MTKYKLGILTLLMAGGLGYAAEVPPPERLLPGDTLGVLTIPEYARTRATFKDSPTSLLWNDPSMKPFREKFSAKLTSEVIAPLEKEFGIKLADYSGLAQGQITLALSSNGPKEKDGEAGLGFTLLVDSREKSAVLQTNLTALKNKWVDGGKQVRVEKIRDVEFTTLIFNSDDFSKVLEKVFPGPEGARQADEAPSKVEWIMGQSGSLFVLGNSTKDIERILVNQGGGTAGTLAEHASFSSSLNSQFRDSHAYAWLDLKTILANVERASKKEGAGAGGAQAFGMSPDRMMNALGLTGLQSLAASVRQSPDGTLLGLNVNVPESARRGLLKIFAFENKDASPPPFVPADAVKFGRWRVDLPKAWETLENALVDAIPQFAGVIKMVLDNAGKDQDPNFDLRKNLIQNLGDDIISFEKLPRNQTLDALSSPPALVLISSPRPEQLASSVRALTALMPSQASKFKEREFLGRKVYALSLPPSMGGAGKPVERTLHYAASGGYVALSTDISTLEEYLRSNDGSGKSLRDTSGLAEAAQKVGGMGTGFFTFENQRATARAEMETLKKESGTLANLLSATPLGARFGGADSGEKLKEWLDFSLLPPYEQISKYFYHTVTGGSVTPQGFSLKVFSAKPPELKN